MFGGAMFRGQPLPGSFNLNGCAMKKVAHVALLIETSNAYCRNLLKGIAAYVRDHQPWSLYLGEHERGASVPSWLRLWEGDGIIARVENEEIATVLVKASVPVVNVSSTDFVKTMPAVVVHEEAMIGMAVEHLLERGYQQFAFCGMARYIWATTREHEFTRRVEDAGGTCHIYRPRMTGREELNWEREQGELATWLQSLPKPIGLLAPNDFRGQQVLNACHRQGIAVPEQVAVISLGDDEVLCDLTFPPMTSVTTNASGAGYQAATLLAHLMVGKKISPRVVRLEPFGVHLRQSTDVTAIADPDIVTALQFIRSNACDGIKIEDIVDEISLSRRTFEQQFKKMVGRTPHEEILRVKLARAKRLLAESDLSLTQIANRVGFTHASYLCGVFRTKTGLTPSQYRKKFQPMPIRKSISSGEG